MRHVLHEEGLADRVAIDSAGTSAYHVGEAPDARSTAAARERGIRMTGAARQFVREDFHGFDYVLAMDGSNYTDLVGLAATAEHKDKVHLFRSFDPASEDGAEVPDPYYGGKRGFDEVLDICDAACRGLLAHLRREHGI